MKDQFRSDARIGAITVPTLVLHGELDRVVPMAFGERLYAAIRAPKRFVRFANGEHEGLDAHGAVAADSVERRRPTMRGATAYRACLPWFAGRAQPPRSFTILERSNERAGRDRDRKFNPLVLGAIHAAGDTMREDPQ